jgi:hypothetical protein
MSSCTCVLRVLEWLKRRNDEVINPDSEKSIPRGNLEDRVLRHSSKVRSVSTESLQILADISCHIRSQLSSSSVSLNTEAPSHDRRICLRPYHAPWCIALMFKIMEEKERNHDGIDLQHKLSCVSKSRQF